MGAVESISIQDVSHPKVGKFLLKGKSYTLEEIVSLYNVAVSRVQFFESRSKEYLTYRDKYAAEIKKLQHEMAQLKNVLNLKIDAEVDSRSSKEGDKSQLNDLTAPKNQRLAVSAEATKKKATDYPKIPKSLGSSYIIKSALLKNEFLEYLDKSQTMAIVDYMIPKSFNSGEFVITQGEYGNGFYVIEEGVLEVYKNGEKLPLKPLTSGTLFGELAILYNCTRTASVKAITNAKLFFIKREVYQTVMKQNATIIRKEYLDFLQSITVLKDCDKLILKKISDMIDEVTYSDGEYIVREGEKGDSFYIIKSGKVHVLKHNDKGVEVKLNSLKKGQCFGEKALLENETRSASVIAKSSVVCLTLDRDMFLRIAGNVAGSIGKDYKDNKKTKKTVPRMESKVAIGKTDFDLGEFVVITNLGQGAFGKVDLIENTNSKERYALKKLDKAHIVKTKQQDHTNSEREFLFKSTCPFIVKMYQTFRDEKNVYLLLDACLGGDLFTVLHGVSRFESKSARFYVGCAIEAFDYIHSNGYVYRDLKPENMLLDSKGYVKLVDFGFTKKLKDGEKTFTFCGTPEYVAPEVILSKGHDRTADYWSLGILIYELINGNPPFSSNDSMSTYRMILRGIDSITFSKKIPKHAAQLVRALCRENPSERIGNEKDGIDAIRKHKWFEGFHWSGLQHGTLTAPLIPKEPKFKVNKELKKLQSTKEYEQKSENDWDMFF